MIWLWRKCISVSKLHLSKLCKLISFYINKVFIKLNSEIPYKWKSLNLSLSTKHSSNCSCGFPQQLYLTLYIIIKIISICIHFKTYKDIVIDLYYWNFQFQQPTRLKKWFSFPQSFKFSSFICSVILVRKCKSQCSLPLILSICQVFLFQELAVQPSL